MSIYANDCWNEEIKEDIIKGINDYLFLYLFKEGIPQLDYPILNLFDLSKEDMDYLKMVHFLISPQIKDLMNVLPSIMRNMAHSTQKELVQYNGIIRGRINWNMTLKTRYAQGYNDPSLFLCTPSSKSYDVEENQLLKFLLSQSVKMVHAINLGNLDYNVEEIEYWQTIITQVYYSFKHNLKNVHFNDVTNISNVPNKAFRRATNQRNKSYVYVAKAYQLYYDLFIDEDLNVLKDLIQHQILEPMNLDQLYEVYVFFKLIEVLEKEGEDLNLGLLRKGNDYSAKSVVDGVEIKIYYQHTPDIFIKKSKYKKIFESYDLNVNTRRPDVIIEYVEDGKSQYRIVEVKRTDNKDYITDSVYKVLGYRHDFIDAKLTNTIPCVLVVWDGIKIDDKQKALENKLLILNREDYIKNLDNLLHKRVDELV